MASFFRKRIAEKILWSIGNGGKTFKEDVNKVAPLVRVSRKKEENPKLFLPIDKFLESVPAVDNNFSSNNVISTLRNQGLPTAEGITDIELSDIQPISLVFTVDKHVFNRIVLLDICVEFNNISNSSCLLNNLEKKKLLVTFRPPAFGRPLTFSHLRALFHFGFIGNISKYVKQDVNMLLSVEDWGPYCGLLLHGYNKFGINDELERDAAGHMTEVLKASEIRYRDDLSFQDAVSETITKMENDEPEILSLHQKLYKAWLKDLIGVFKRLNVDFTDIQCDSVFHKRIHSVSNDLLARGIVSIDSENNDVRVNVPSDDEMLIFQEGILGSYLHGLSRTVSSACISKEYVDFDELYFVGEKTMGAFYKRVINVLEALGYSWSKNVHHMYFRKLGIVGHQEIGGSELACDVLDKAKTIVLKELKMDITLDLGRNEDDVAESLALAALIVSEMRFRRNHQYTFILAKSLDFKEDSAIAHQFLHAGLLKMQEQSKFKFSFDIDLSPLCEPAAVHLVQHLARFEEIVSKSFTHMEPAFLVQYIQTLSYLTRRAMNFLRLDIKEEKLRVIKARLLLFYATQKVLGQSLKLLGIQPLESL